MARFLSGNDLSNEIRSILKEPQSCSAVAFWGHGSQSWLTGSGARVIANLRMGGTNPHALQKVRAEKRKCDLLHAKVYIGSTRAIVASANASVNGLALEGVEQTGWLEAGMLVEDTGEIKQWFEDLWNRGSQPITEADWEVAERLWSLRSKPPLPSFASFDPSAERLPLIIWVDQSESWTTNEQAVKDAVGISGQEAQRRVDEGLWIKNEDDARYVADRWAFIWIRNANGTLSKRTTPSLTRMSKNVVKGGFSWDEDNEPQDVLLSAEVSPPVPFNPSEPRFLEAFSMTIARAKYAPLLEDDDPTEPWYQPREALTRQFWAEIHAEYLKLPEPETVSY